MLRCNQEEVAIRYLRTLFLIVLLVSMLACQLTARTALPTAELISTAALPATATETQPPTPSITAPPSATPTLTLTPTLEPSPTQVMTPTPVPTPQPWLVLQGKDGWLFYNGGQNIEDYQRTIPFSTADLQKIVTYLDQQQEKAQQRGIQFLVVIVPNKQTTYANYLPDSVQVIGKRSRLDQVINYLADTGSQVPFLDLRPRFDQEKGQYQLFHRTDTHWNDYGAYFGYQAIMESLFPDDPARQAQPLDQFAAHTESFSGDLALFLGQTGVFTETVTRLTPDFEPSAVITKIDEDNSTAILDKTGLHSAVVFYDSYGIPLIPFLAQGFSQTTFRWDHQHEPDMVNWQLVDEKKPQVVILLLVERHLSNFLEAKIEP